MVSAEHAGMYFISLLLCCPVAAIFRHRAYFVDKAQPAPYFGLISRISGCVNILKPERRASWELYNTALNRIL
jgi:hypothetical protein